MTAASYRYHIRGMNSKPTANDVVLAARRRVRLKQYDKLLKDFRCASVACPSGPLSSPSCALKLDKSTEPCSRHSQSAVRRHSRDIDCTGMGMHWTRR